MPPEPASYLEHVGYVLFPRRPDDLTDTTRCPACFEPLTSTTCANCGLDVGNPLAAELATVAGDTAALLQRRLELIGRIRFETAQAAAAPSTAPAPVPVAAPQVAAPAAPPPAVAAPTAPAEPRRHLGVQVVLLIVGISLLAVGAIFFLVYAFITFGLVWRTVIIAAVTVAAFVGASLLRRRRLHATAESIAALAVVLVYLDAFAIRANDFFGSGASDALVYWGATLLVSAALFLLWHRLSGLRVASIAGFAAVVPGLALLVAGLTEPLEAVERVYAGFVGAAVGGVAHVIAARREHAALERGLSLGLGAGGLLGATATSFLLRPDAVWAPTIGLAVVAALAALHAVVAVRSGGVTTLAAVFAGIAAATAGAAVWPAYARDADSVALMILPVVAAAAVTLGAEALARRIPGIVTGAAAWTALGVGALVAVMPVFAVLLTSAGVAYRAALPGVWSLPGTADLDLRSIQVASVVALALVIALTAAAWGAQGLLRRRRLLPLWAGAALLVLAVPLTGVLWAAVTGWLVLAAGATMLLVVWRGRSADIRLLLAGNGLLALVLGYTASWASLDLWWIGSLVAIAVLVVARRAVTAPVARAALLGVAVVLAFAALGAEAWHGNEVLTGGEGRGIDAMRAVLAASILVLAATAIPRLAEPDRRTLFWLGAATATLTASGSWAATTGTVPLPALLAPEFVTSTALGAALAIALVIARGGPAERTVASIGIAPAGAWAAASLARVLGVQDGSVVVAAALAAVVVAAIALATARPQRWAWDAGAALVALSAVLLALASSSDAAWLVLLTAAVTALLVAVSRDGLFGSASPRRHLGWASLALGTAALWRRLADDAVQQPEAYVLPVAGALLLVALLAWRAARPQPSRVAPFVALGGLLIGLLPLAIDALDGEPARPIALAAVAAALLLLGGFVRGDARSRPYLDAAALAGALGVLVLTVGRPWTLVVNGGRGSLELDAWLAAGLVVLLAAAVGQSRLADPVRAVVGQVLVGLGLLGVTVVELAAAEPGELGAARSFAVIVVLGAVHLVAFVVGRPPFTRWIAWGALALSALVAVVALSRGILDPIEWATVPVAVALLLSGAWRLRHDPRSRSWPWLGPGIVVLLVPPLVATFVDDAVWRLVALGVVSVAAIVIGALGRLQAPLLLGSAIVLVHALRTFAPQLRAIYEVTEWWVWAVVGGAIIVFLGFTIERRIRDFRTAAARVSSLR